MEYESGYKFFERNSKQPPLPSGDHTLDELLSGGFHKELVYLLYGDKKRTTNVLLTTSVKVQQSKSNGGLGDGIKIAFIDGNNRFNPYNISKYAVSQHLSPQKVLDNIIIARAFTWEQMVELLENRLSDLEHVKVVMISGITSLLQSYEKETFEDILKSINGIKRILERTKPLIIITAPLNKNSLFRPEGGKIISHFGNVLVQMNEDERYIEYKLIQHPYKQEMRLLKWKPRPLKRNLSKPMRNTTMDRWF